MTTGDITRSTFDPSHHYSAVRMQQGRVQLDADWNEQLDIEQHHDRSQATDTIGAAGVPKVGGGFELVLTPDGADLLINPGRMWVAGRLCEVDGGATSAVVSGADVTVTSLVLDHAELAVHDWVLLTGHDGTVALERVKAIDRPGRRVALAAVPPALTAPVTLIRLRSYSRQPDLPHPALTTASTPTVPGTLTLADGAYLAYLDVWERGVTAVEAPSIVEPALGGPDATTRSRTVWQVRLARLEGAPADVDCASDLGTWTKLLDPPTGTMAARAEPDAGTVDLCTPTPAGGYTGIENQLYRVQVHSVAGDGRPRIVWSRDNGSVVTTWLSSVADRLKVSGIGRDAVLGFAGDQWVELLDDGRELSGTPGTLVRLLKAEGDTLRVDPTSADGSFDYADFGDGVAKVRRWDSDGVVTVDFDTWVNLEHGVQVRFSSGTYAAGDFWLIPARSALADVDWPVDSTRAALSMPPAGVEHTWAPLAIVKRATGVVTVLDCRSRFPSLTTLTAADVAFDDTVCAMPGVANVQQALDRLCQEHDLRRHHKLLHGWGIVCGLQVHCGPDDQEVGRRNVTLLKGTAIDVEGNDLDVIAPIEVDVIAQVDKLRETVPDVLDEQGNGEVCLRLDADSRGNLGVGVEKLDPADEQIPGILQGTLLFDFYDDCIRSLHEWLKEELTRAEGDTSPVSPGQERLDALVNLIAQPVNGRSGANIFLSPREDKLLQNFYAGLRSKLQSETFCAMFDNARLPAPYPAGLEGVDTIFGIGGHTRLRLRPRGAEAYTVGAGLSLTKPTPYIHRYDLKTGKLVSRIDPVAGKEVTAANKPDAGTNATTDVAFSRDGRSIYVIVPTRAEDDTMFRVGDIVGATIKWRPGITICGVKLVTLAVAPNDPKMVYAVGLRKVTTTTNGKTTTEWHGAGIYAINPDSPDPNAQPIPAGGFFPVGQLVIGRDDIAVATSIANDDSVGKGSYTQLTQFALPSGQQMETIQLGATGEDDITLVDSPFGQAVYAVVRTQRGKGVQGFVLGSGQPLHDGVPIDVQSSSGAVRLVGSASILGVTSADEYVMRVVDTATGAVLPEARIPLQVGPISAATDDRRAYVLNYLSNTITVIDLEALRAGRMPDLVALAAYRKAMIEAFADLLAGFIQYLKDCFFDHFLVRCPQPTGVEKIYLACVSIRGGGVYKVCNFSRRRYVKSFPTVGYWLSALPILPLAKEWLAKVACAVVPEFMSKLTVHDSSDSADRLSVQQLQQLLNWAQSADLLDKWRGVKGRAHVAAKATMFALSKAQPQPSPPVAPRLVGPAIIDQPVEHVERQLGDRGLLVTRSRFEPSIGLAAPANLGNIFRNPTAGDEVTLYEDDAGVVRYYNVARAASPQPDGAAPAGLSRVGDGGTAALADRVAALERELMELRAAAVGVPTPAPLAKRAPAKKATPAKSRAPRAPSSPGDGP